MKKLFLLLVLVACTAQARVKPAAGPESVLVLNVSTGRVEYERNADKVRSIASITKLVTAMVTLDHDRDLDKKLLLNNRVGTKLVRTYYTRRQLLEAMLINSDNAAAETLAEDFPGGRAAFVSMMNWYAKNWELPNTHFADPSGLSPFNVSTAYEVADLIHTASGYWLVQDIGTKKQQMLETRHKQKIRKIQLQHTSGKMLEFDNVVISKTGLTSAAGWCVAMVVGKYRKEFAIVILGAKNKDARYNTVKNIMYNHVVDN